MFYRIFTKEYEIECYQTIEVKDTFNHITYTIWITKSVEYFETQNSHVAVVREVPLSLSQRNEEILTILPLGIV